MTKAQKAKAKEYFKSYPDATVIHETSDGQIFLQSNYNDAVNHQVTLTKVDASAKLSSYHKKQLDEPTDEELAEEEGKGGKTVELKPENGDSNPPPPPPGEGEKNPDESWKNADIAAWLVERGVTIEGQPNKAALLEKVAEALKPKGDTQE